MGLGNVVWVVALGVGSWARVAFCASELAPGSALPAELEPSEAEVFEALLHEGDTVAARRRFDELGLLVGLGLGYPLLSRVSIEASPWDAVAVGGEGGLSFWGGAIGGYARVRPWVWGGQGRALLSALSLQAGYRYMSYGDEPFSGWFSSLCHADCARPLVSSTFSHWLDFQAGFEHAFAAGWVLRYAMGAAWLPRAPAWACTSEGQAASCGDVSLPASTSFSSVVVLSKAVF
jgi:hypothetical protein